MISEETLHFVRSSIKSVWALELLLFIRQQAGRTWSIAALTQELRSNAAVVTEILTAFKAAGLVEEESSGLFRYRPATAKLAQLVEQVDKAHAERPLAIVREILAAPNEKIRTFADAFKLKKD